MMYKSKWVRGLLIVLGVVFLTAALGCGADKPKEEKAVWPQKDVEVVWHSKAGSGGDIYLRTLGKAVEPKLGKAWVVNNMPGASGANAWNYVAKAKADGHVLLGTSPTIIGAQVANNLPIGYKNFDPVAMMLIDPIVIYVKADAPFKSLKEIIEDAKKNPGKQKWAGGTPGDISNVAMRLLMQAGQFQVAMVPFEGGGDAVAAVLGGHLIAGVGEYAEIRSTVEAGQMRILATFNKMPTAPSVPSVAEQGYPSVVVEKFRGVMAPKGTPAEVIAKAGQILKDSYNDPNFKKYIESNHLVPAFKNKDEFAKVLDAQFAQVKEAQESLKK